MSPSPRPVKDNAPYLSIRGLLVVLAIISQLSALNFSARATELADLGEGQSYLRIHAIDEAANGLTTAIREREFLVLDLRHASTTTDSAELLRSALAAREFKQPVFILIGPATPTAIVDSFASAAGKSLTLGVKESFPTPQIIIDQPAAADRLAYDALESGQTLSSLVSGKIGKERFDEAALMKEFSNGNFNATPPPPPDPTTKPTEAVTQPALGANAGNAPTAKATDPAKTEPLIDRVLQRAVHLHRALIALRR